MRRAGVTATALVVVLLATLAGSVAPARAFGPTAPYVDTGRNTDFSDVLRSPGFPSEGNGANPPPSPPPGAGSGGDGPWEDGLRGARLLPALRVLAGVGIGATLIDHTVGWKFGVSLWPGKAIYQGITGQTWDPGAFSSTGATWVWRVTGGLSGASFLPGGSPGPAWVLTRVSGSQMGYCVPASHSFGFTDWSLAAAGAPGTALLTTQAGGSICSGSGETWVKYKTEASMDATTTVTPSDATGYAATGTHTDTGTYTPPSDAGTTDSDRAAARAALGQPVAGKNSSGQPVDGSGSVLTPDQVAAQNWVNCVLDHSFCAGGANDPTGPGGPLADVVVMPDCVGATVAVCSGLLGALGWTGGMSSTVLDRDGAVVTRPAGAIVTQSPGATTTLPKTGTVTVTRNPDTLPLLLPQPGANETYEDYIGRLAALGYVGTVTRVNLSPEEEDSLTGPNGAARVRVPTATGTRLITRAGWPLPLPRVFPGESITIYTNPETAPDVPTGDDGEPDGSDPGIDFGPLTGLDPGCKFPFGLFCYAKQVTTWFVVSPQAPAFHFTFATIGGFAIGGGGHYDVDLGDVPGLDGYMAIWRTLLSIALWVGAVWVLASRFLGLNLGDPGEAVDDP
jgi:hypothetical protein